MSRRRGATRFRLNLDRALVLCTSQKVSYPTRERAFDQAEIMMDMGHVSPGCHLVPYLCGDCRRWHVKNRRIWFRPEGLE